MALGEAALGRAVFGMTALGGTALGRTAFGMAALGRAALGKMAIGRAALEGRCLDQQCLMGVTEVDDGIWKVTFMDYDIGCFDEDSYKFSPLDNPLEKLSMMYPV